MEENWELIYTTDKMYNAEMAQDRLEEEGLESVILKKKGSAFLVGEIELYVQKEEQEKAKTILKDFES
jgi:hypothetical protein